MKTIHYILSGFLLMGLTACHKAYPGLYAPEIDYENPNPEVTTDHVPVMLSMYDPLYALVTTRGQGAFGAWGSSTEARKRWQDARFGVYAFLTNNSKYTGGADYTAAEIGDGGGTPYCLVRDRKVKITGSCELTWEDEVTRYYSALYPEYKFNFFLYYTDNAREYKAETVDRTKIVRHIEVDGTQDIISAYARPGGNDKDKLQTGDDESRYLINHWDDLIYSARAGHRRIDPIFKVKHEMACLQFSLEGMKDIADKVIIDAVVVRTPFRGDFTVAADWEGVRLDNEDMTPPTGVVWNYADTKKVYVCDKVPEDFDAVCRPENRLKDVSVGYGEVKEVGRPMLLPPASFYGITVNYRYIDDAYPTLKDKQFSVTFERVTTVGGSGFQAGGRHLVNLQIYGPQLVHLTVDRASIGWMEANDDLTIGGDGDSKWDYM